MFWVENFYYFIFVNQENHIPLAEIIKISKPPEMTTRKKLSKAADDQNSPKKKKKTMGIIRYNGLF